MAETKEKVQAETSAPEQPATPSLNLQDLITVAQIIQLSSQRGAFRAEELESVGSLYNKLIAFLQSVGALRAADAPTEENQND